MKVYSHPQLSEVSLATVMQALSDPCRIAIVRSLLESPCPEYACNQFPLKISKATISHHFDVLRQAGLIRTRTEGTKCLSSLRREELDERFPGLLELVLKSGVSSCSEETPTKGAA